MTQPRSHSRREFAGLAAKSTLGALALGAGTASTRATTTVSGGAAPAARGVWKVIRNPKVVESPLGMPAGETYRYLLAYPFQIGPNVAASYCNLKMCGGPGQDFEGGADVFIFDRLGPFDPARAIKITRNEILPNPNNGGLPAVIAKYPGTLGFVPLGAKLSDGRPHPHAGTGFILATALAWPLDRSDGYVTYPDRLGITGYGGSKAWITHELYQLSWDGSTLKIGLRQVLADTDVIAGQSCHMTGLGCAIADGEDLIVGMNGSRPGANATVGACGMQRWSRVNGAWRPGAFEVVSSDDNTAIEPTLVRDLDGSLLFNARGRRHQGPPLRVWRQAAPGQPWELRFNLNRMVPSTPISINRAVDGTPFVAGNFYQPEFKLPAGLQSDGGVSRLEPVGWRGERSTLCVWPLNGARNGLEAQFIAKDPRVEYGLPPHGTVWAVDHPVASPVRLADHQWHSLMGYRLLEWKENTHFIPPSPQTGCYLNEIVSFGPPVPLWNF